MRRGSAIPAIAFSLLAASSSSSLLVQGLQLTKPQNNNNRRSFLQNGLKAISAATVGLSTLPAVAAAEEVTSEELDAIYQEEDIPQYEPPEERSGLVVLRVAEVAQFQEQILRNVANGNLEGVKVAPMQFVFGNQILLKNSNLDANMKLMIYNEIPQRYRKAAIENAVATMNGLQDISVFASKIERDFEIQEMLDLADMYRDVRIHLNQLYEYLEPKERDKYYGYFVKVTEYEKKVAQGTYNPDIDGKLQFD